MGNRWFFSIVGAWSITIAGFSLPEAALIRGVVTDSLTKAPVDSALVQVKGTSVKTSTDGNGRFAINTTTGITRPMLDWTAPNAAGSLQSMEIWSADGALRIKKTTVAGQAAILSGLPAGVYFIRSQMPRGATFSKALITERNCRIVNYAAGSGPGLLAKTGFAAVTLVYSHKYYTGKEATASEGDTNVTAILRIWFPSPSTTGPSNPSLITKTVTNPTISTNGTILENTQITGTVTINASNVIVRNFRISTGDYFSFVTDGTNIVIQDGELDGQGTCDEAFRGSGYTAQRLYVHNYEGDAFKASDNCVIEGCYITHIGVGADAHGDGMQSLGGTGITVIHNNFDLSTGQINSCIFPGGGSTVYNLAVKQNRLNGGGWVIYCNQYTEVIGNQFGNAGYGPVTNACALWKWNAWENTGVPAN